MSDRKPSEGDRIIHVLTHLNLERHGTVLYLLGSMFCYQPDDHHVTQLCNFNEDWHYET